MVLSQLFLSFAVVSVENTSAICVLHTEMWSDHHQSVWNDMKKQNELRQTESRNLPVELNY